MIKALAVVGRFDDNGGRPSGYAKKLFDLNFAEKMGFELTVVNGGNWSFGLLPLIKTLSDYKVLFWFPDIPDIHGDNGSTHSRTKIVDCIKDECPHTLLISSKNVEDRQISFPDLVGRALKTKSNLLVEFSRDYDGRWNACVLDPLGNIYGNRHERDVYHVRNILFMRVLELTRYTRVSSQSMGTCPITVPNEEEFFELARKYADIFHKLNPEMSSERFLGNLSFRCGAGFPSFKSENFIFVSRRNVDKRAIGPEHFVAVNPIASVVQYYGDKKPSVDTPIQLHLYKYYSKVKYMLHSHCYVLGAPFTKNVVPCGAIEEVQEITELYPNANFVNFAVNLKGHGSLVLVDSVRHLENIFYVKREIPEKQEVPVLCFL